MICSESFFHYQSPRLFKLFNLKVVPFLCDIFLNTCCIFVAIRTNLSSNVEMFCVSLRKFQVICHQCHNIVLDFLWMSKHLHNNHFFQLFLSIDRMIFQRQVPTLEKYGGQDLALLEISLFWWIHLKVPQWHLNHKIHI